jgi:chromosome segregation ATPase
MAGAAVSATATLRNQLGDWHRESSLLHRRAETTQRELAVGNERLRQLEARRLDLLAELAPLQERLHSQQQQVQSAEGRAQRAAGRTWRGCRARHRRAAGASERGGKRAAHPPEPPGHGIQRRQTQLEGELAAQERKLLEQESRKATLDEERQRLDAELIAAQGSQAELTPQLHELAGPAGRDWKQEGSALAARRQDAAASHRPERGRIDPPRPATGQRCAATPTACTTSSICCSA